ncbi:helix-turn-helix transcriptional regulator [Actinomadura montaniterrae]|uniref:Helix-turn-helix transcriptional regulator n=1 Tax=Actinomadura montaniterrae TaxID=1803903 RepID=A0A6L3W371_9ACTN|nr:helix-turn-helix transcriptional regulator [Actinomadura montaniterrae]
MAKVAARVGITEADVLHHFSSKADLLAGVLRHRDSIAPDALANVKSDDIIESVHRMADLARTLLDHLREAIKSGPVPVSGDLTI